MACTVPVSIRAPREGGDRIPAYQTLLLEGFIRAPREGGDHLRLCRASRQSVSIRAPREGGDKDGRRHRPDHGGFNPRPP